MSDAETLPWRTPFAVAEDLPEKADFWARAVALGLDLALLAFLHLGLFILMGRSLLAILPPEPGVPVRVLLGCFVLFLIGPAALAAAYFTVLHACGGRTLGKMLMGVRVITMEGEALAPGVSFLRTVGYLISAFPLPVGFLWAVLDIRGQAWHDKLAGTLVVAG